MADDATTYNVLEIKAQLDVLAQQLDVFVRTLAQYQAQSRDLKATLDAVAAQYAIDLEPASSPAASPASRASSGGASRGSRGAGTPGKDD
jgi:hypothetical protein